MSSRLTLLGAFLGAVALTGAAGPAAAAPGDTVASFALIGGSVGVSLPVVANLGTADTGAVTVNGNLGSTQVTDTRGLSVGWQVSAATTGFLSDSGTRSVAVTYNPGSITKTGTVTPVSLGTVPLTSVPAPVVTGTLALGNNSATWNPQISVTLPADSLAGTYTGTVTTSVA